MAQGRKVYAVEANEVGVEELLLGVELLREGDRAADGEFPQAVVEAALGRLIDLLQIITERDASRSPRNIGAR